MSKFRKKPVVIEAFQFKPVWRIGGAWADNAPVWFLQAEQDGIATVWGDDEVPYIIIKTLEGNMKGEAGDWIIKGVKGEIYPCKPDIFLATYDPA